MDEFYYETGKPEKDQECGLCEKICETVRARCKLGSFDGKLCAKCLFRMSKSRSATAKKPAAPQNGQSVHQVHEFG